jgi:hypothetical protein
LRSNDETKAEIVNLVFLHRHALGFIETVHAIIDYNNAISSVPEFCRTGVNVIDFPTSSVI